MNYLGWFVVYGHPMFRETARGWRAEPWYLVNDDAVLTTPAHPSDPPIVYSFQRDGDSYLPAGGGPATLTQPGSTIYSTTAAGAPQPWFQEHTVTRLLLDDALEPADERFELIG